MKYIIALLLFACCLTLTAEHVYPTNPDPAHTAFFGQLGRDSIVVTNPPPSMTAEEAAEIANHAISTNVATTNLTARLAAKAAAADLTSHTGDTDNPHQVTAVQVGALPNNGESHVFLTLTPSSHVEMHDGSADFLDGSNVRVEDGRTIRFFDHISETTGEYETSDQRITRIAREHSGDYWDEELQVWWTGRMSGGKLTYMATTNVNLNAEH